MKRFFTIIFVLFFSSCSINTGLSSDDVVFNQENIYYSTTGMGYDLEIINNNDDPITYLEVRVYSSSFDYVVEYTETIKGGDKYVIDFYHSHHQGVVHYDVISIE